MSEYHIASFGEALVDLVMSDNGFQPYVGGAPANVAVAVSKLGGQSHFIGSVGDDVFGNMIVDELRRNQVNTEYTLKLSDHPTAAAYVSLDEQGERSFSFSRHDTADTRFPISAIPVELFKNNKGIFHFGSNSLTTDYLASITLALLALASKNGWSVSFDVNLRANLWPQGKMDKARIMQFVALADLIKMSDEEMQELDIQTSFIEQQAKSVFVVTSGPQTIRLYTKGSSIEHQPQAVKAVDTTGAGDAFFGAFLHFVAKNQLFGCSSSGYQGAVEFAAACGAYSVQHMGATSSYPEYAQLVL
ncbi:MAG: carbohydrate kinase family protein [Arenicella sp.]